MTFKKIKKITLARISCFLIGHDWKLHTTFFYCVDNYPKFTKLWEDYYSCERCELKIQPKWFKKSWRVKHQLAIFDTDSDLKGNLSEKEANAYKKTKILINILNKRQGVIKED